MAQTTTNAPVDQQHAPYAGTWRCEVCGAQFNDERQYREHRDNHDRGPAADHTYTCPKCKEGFDDEKAFHMHEAKHMVMTD